MRKPHFTSLCALLALIPALASAARYEAESAIVDANSVVQVTSASASGGSYVNMKEGTLSFSVTAPTAGPYTLWANYSVDDPNGKIQNISVNGVSAGQASFPLSVEFKTIKASAKIVLKAGANTISITKSWGWVLLDYIEVTDYVPVPWQVVNSLVTPTPSANAKKMMGFLYENFGKKTISGVMTSDVMLTDGKNTPMTLETQTEVKWIKTASRKQVALLGVDFLHGTGKSSDQGWYQGYTNGTLALAEEIFQKGGIPIFCWHWKDPLKNAEAFYTPGRNNGSGETNFNLNKAFADSATHAEWNTASPEYTAMLADIDIVAGYLKKLADKDVPVLWRPVHEAAGGWFWWGSKGSAATKKLWQLMFDRLVNHHKLNNLIWVWTSDESGSALDWYPGDASVDIVGRDFYFDPRQSSNHSSLVGSFEKLKDFFGARKIVTLSENGAVPYPDEMLADGANWSWFMSWNLDWAMDGWNHDNTAADWNTILNHDYVLTLDEMPGWASYTPPPYTTVIQGNKQIKFGMHYAQGILQIALARGTTTEVGVYSIQGRNMQQVHKGYLSAGEHAFSLSTLSPGIYVIRVRSSAGSSSQQIQIPTSR